MFSSSHLPRTTGEVRVAYEVTVRMLPWPSRPRRGLVGKRDAPEVTAVDVRDAVVAGQPLVHEGVVGGQQIDHAAILAKLALDEQLGLALERLPQVVVEHRETR